MIGITIRGPQQREKLAAITMPCGFGRQADPANPELSIADPFVSRRHVELETTQDDRSLLVRCVGGSAITIASGDSIEPGNEQIVPLPVSLRIGRTEICVECLDLGVNFLKPPMAQAIDGRRRAASTSLALTPQGEISPERLVEWFEGLIAFQASVTNAIGFYEQAARAVVEMIGLDRCVVIGCDDEWKVEVEYGAPSDDGMVYSHSIVSHVLAYRQTVYLDDASDRQIDDSASAYVGAPIVDGTGRVVACLFGVRNSNQVSQQVGIRPLEAQLVQVTAGIVGSRLARLAAEAEQTRTQVQLEQFASPQLVREMQNNPHWLEAQERELTLLFGDIRGFSQLGERLEAQEIYSFVREVMDCMTQVIHDHGGFVFNFAGDGIAAMWNAPGRNASHPLDACQAAIEIQNALQNVDERWADRVGRAVKVGLGVNTGKALVGNSGSKARLKYSPLGHAVNLASRIEGATKAFGVSILVSDATHQLVSENFASRYLGEIVVVGMDHPTRVFQLAQSDVPQASSWWPEFENAVRLLENGQVSEARSRTEQLLQQNPDDGPLQVLQARIDDCDGQVRPWVLSGK